MLFLAAVSAQVGIAAALVFQLVFGIVLFVNHPSYQMVFFCAVCIYCADIIRGDYTGISLVALAVSGLVLSLVNSGFPIFRQQPFWLARNLWLILATVIFLTFRNSFSLGKVILDLPLHLIVNLILLNLLILITRGTRSSNTNADIVIT